MPSLEEFIAEVDAFMAARKQLSGATTAQTWQQGRQIGEGALQVVLPIEINGEMRSNTGLTIIAFPDEPELTFRIVLVYRRAVYRLDFDQDDTHINRDRPAGTTSPYFVNGPHYHPWTENRGFITNPADPFKLPFAVELDRHITRFDHALRWFCQQTNIELRDHAIELPPRQRLL